MELYVHIPFCVRKCRYCSFASFPAEEAEKETYIDLLLREAAARRKETEEPIRTVYFGGGTPSLLSPDLLTRLTSGLRNVFFLDDVQEFTAEANPGTVTKEWLDAAAEAGINRISFGMQAYQDKILSTLGRIHRFSDVCNSVESARSSGIKNISLDLIFGVPGQTTEDWSETIEAALSLSPDHISAYGLIPEEHTPLYDDLKSGKHHLPDPDREREMYWDAVGKLISKGYSRYEISNFAKPGYECKHNIGYWSQIPYIGLGLSAASMIFLRKTPDGMTYVRRNNPELQHEYRNMVVSAASFDLYEKIDEHDARFETMMLGLRMCRGVNEEEFFRLHGVTLDSCYGPRLSEFEQKGLMMHRDGFWRMTDRGFDIQNSILVDLMD